MPPNKSQPGKGGTRPSSRPTIHDVAAAAGVSIGTVSRVAVEHPRVAARTRARVLEAMNAIGYQPNAAARAMRTNSTKTIGFLLPDIRNPVFAQVASGAEAVLAAEGYMLFAFSSSRSPTHEVEFLRAARQRQMDGLIVTLADETAEPTIAELRRMGVPLVLLDREVPVEADLVLSEHKQAIGTVVSQLAALGHTRIALIAASRNIRPGRDRVTGFREAMQAAGLNVEERLIRAHEQSRSFGAAEAHALLSSANPPTAIIAGGNDIFHGALHTIRLLGLEIPRDLSFVGADDMLVADLVAPPITMIDRDMAEVGRQAARLLLDRLRGDDGPPRVVLLPSTVVMRRSLAAPRILR